jgi:hypothetical protein
MGRNFYREDMLNALLTLATVPAEFAGCLVTADFLSGALHWAEDTWLAPGRNALLARWVVLPNIEHHERHGRIRQGHQFLASAGANRYLGRREHGSSDTRALGLFVSRL